MSSKSLVRPGRPAPIIIPPTFITPRESNSTPPPVSSDPAFELGSAVQSESQFPSIALVPSSQEANIKSMRVTTHHHYVKASNLPSPPHLSDPLPLPTGVPVITQSPETAACGEGLRAPCTPIPQVDDAPVVLPPSSDIPTVPASTSAPDEVPVVPRRPRAPERKESAARRLASSFSRVVCLMQTKN